MTRKTPAAVAVALMALLFSPGCAQRKGPPDPAKVQQKMAATLDAERELVRSTVADTGRADRLVELLAQRDRLVAEQAERIVRYRERMLALSADYDAERADFEEAAGVYNTERREWQRQVAELLAAMKNETTAEEWKTIAKYQHKKLNPRELAYGNARGGN